MSNPKVSIITVNYNNKRFLDKCLASIRKIDYPNYEVILVDNNSIDKSVEMVKKKYPWTKVIKNQRNFGFAKANNQGVKKASGSYLFFLNNDAKIAKKTISLLVKKMEEEKNLAICGCRILSYDGKVYFHTGIDIDIFGFPVNNGRLFYTDGAAMMVRKKIFNQLGKFDEKYFIFHEDIDLCWRVLLSGYQIAALPEAIVYHFIGASAGGNFPGPEKYQSTILRRYYSERNNLRTILKNYSLISLFFVLPVYLFINFGEILLFILVLKPKMIFYYLKAYLWNIINIKDTIKKRNTIQGKRKISDLELIRKMSFGSGKFLMFKKIGLPAFN